MKKIFYIIASAIVALGAVACQNDIEEGIKPENKGEGVSFTAEIADLTRVAVLDSDKEGYDKMLAWEGNETIVATYDSKDWEFTNTTEDPYTFTCKDEGAEVLLGKSMYFIYNNKINYDAHANGSAQTFQLSASTTNLGSAPVTFNLVGGGLIFHFTCAEETVIKWYGTDDNIGYFSDSKREHTFAAGEHYISAEGGGLNMTLEAWVDGVKIKSTSRTFDAGKIYNLGVIKVAKSEIFGSWNSWASAAKMLVEGEWHVARNFALFTNAYNQFKIVNDGWWGHNDKSVVPDKEYTLSTSGSDLELPAGVYNIFFNPTTKKFKVEDVVAEDTPQYKVYVYNKSDWTNINIWSWSAGINMATNEWPGDAITETATIGSTTYNVFTMPKKATGREISLLLNNGTAQTSDTNIGTLNSDVYLRLNADKTINTIADPTNPDEMIARTITVTDSNNWGTVKIFVWGPSGLPTDISTWSGTAMAKQADGTYTYTFDKKFDGATINMVLNNGKGGDANQTVDITNIKLNKDRSFTINTGSGKKTVTETTAI